MMRFSQIIQHPILFCSAFCDQVNFTLKMEGNTLMVFLLVASVGLVLSSPVSRPNYDNIPQCLQPPASGLCLAYIPSYYYNPSKETCDSFIFGGCQGNANRFFSFEECMSTCGGFKQETTEFKLILENGEDQESSKVSEQAEENICSQPSIMGPCRAMMPRFYFNGDKCESFIYGGCQGNGNNFRTVEECQTTCKVTASSEEVSEKVSEEASSENDSQEASSANDSQEASSVNNSQEASSKNDSEEISTETESKAESESKEE